MKRPGESTRGKALSTVLRQFLAAWLLMAANPWTVQAGEALREPLASSSRGENISVTGARLEDRGDSAKLSFELSAIVDVESFVLANPDRVVVDLPQIDFVLDPSIGRPVRPPRRKARGASPSLVTSFRFGRLEQTKSRIVIDLGTPSRIIRALCEKSPGSGQTLVIELARTDRASFRAAAQRARASLVARRDPDPPVRATPTEKGKPVVVLDPGHGGIDSGAIVNGLTEKTVVLDFARLVAAKLEADGRLAVVMTRNDDEFIALAERVRMARESDALLFVSIHADVLSGAKDVAGATVYTVSERASDAEAALLAAKENEADAAAGLEGVEDSSDVSGILSDLTRRETRALSHVFARTLLNYWKIVGRLNKNPQRSAGFRVLKAPDVPSILLELGYLSNQKDDAALSSAEWREKAAAHVAEAILAFSSPGDGALSVTAVQGEAKKASGSK
jgi:N-acetylmuramoyl-L-alanine amidase